MTKAPALRIFSLAAALLCLPMLASAATLQAKVVQVDSGNTLVVSNINRPLRIRLKAVAPPESGQPFSDAARDHLKALVFDKAVFVEYTHLSNGYLEAKVILNGIDIGSQMLRDGVAWYDRVSAYELGESDRALYEQCELAARNEKRGLWQDPAAVAPWEFRKAQLERVNNGFSSQSLRQAQSRGSARQGGLSSSDMLGGFVGSGSMAGQPTFRPISANGSPDRWTRYDSVAGHFSILIPSDGVESISSVLDSQGHPQKMQFLAAGNKGAMYSVLFSKVYDPRHTDASAADEVVQGYIDSVNEGFKRAGVSDRVTATPVRELKLNGYGGKQYRLNGPAASGIMRVYSRQVGDQRDIIALCVVTRSGSESAGDQFLNSLRITGN